MMDGYKLLFGDLHTHFQEPEGADTILDSARENIDFCAVLCYPFSWEVKNGLRVETVRQRPEFLQWWEGLRGLARDYDRPGEFVTFLGYEWHGNRTRYGDHNVIYCDDGLLDDAWSLPELYANLRERRAFVLPHHTGYCPGWRSKDWDVYDETLSPVMEVFSQHGSSEGCNTPFPMERNASMGPRACGSTFQDALARGHRIGVIASNDGAGLPGRWGGGRAAVWARDCTREAIWEAIQSRRTYAVTGDRIELDFHVAGAAMGSVTSAGRMVEAEVAVVGSHAIDRVELVHNGRVVDTYCHSGRWEASLADAGRVKLFFQAGWGPAGHYGFASDEAAWDCRLEVEGGRVAGVERCFTLAGQHVDLVEPQSCRWRLRTAGRRGDATAGICQGMVLEIEGGAETSLRFQVEGLDIQTTVGDLLRSGRLIPLLDECRERVQREFGLDEADLGNPDLYYHNARKIKLHQAIPEAGYRVTHTFSGVKLRPGRNYLYIRVSQLNGQMAWSSPVWVEAD